MEEPEFKPQEKKKTNFLKIFKLIIIILLLLLFFCLGYYFGLRVIIQRRGEIFLSIPADQKDFSFSDLNNKISLANSYLFASPLSAMADTKEKIRITVFLLDNEGRGIKGEKVMLQENQDLFFFSVQPITDELGRAIFDIAAKKTGDYLIQAVVAGKILPQTLKINFY